MKDETPAGEGPAGARRLDRPLLASIAWTGAAKWLTQIVSWASTIVVARLLSPDDYGLVGMANVYLGLVMLVTEFGLGAAVVNHRELTPNQVSQINSLCVLSGVAAFAVSCAVAGPLSLFFAAPQLHLVIIALSANFIITSFRTVPLSILQRDLEFRALALNDTVQGVALALAMVIFSVMGLKYWALVLGALLSRLLATVLVLRLRWPGFAPVRVGEIRPAISFGGDIVGSRVAWYIYSTSDSLIVGKLLGKAALGAYTIAGTMASVPVEKITSLVGSVTPAFFAAMQRDLVALRRYLLLLTEGLAYLTFPAAVGLALVADDFVPVVLGDQWQAAILPMRLLACYVTFRSIVPIVPQMLNAIGESRFGMKTSIFGAIVMPIAFLIGTRWGLAGVAAGWIVAYPVVVLPAYQRLFRRIELRPVQYLQALWPPLSAALTMAVAVIAFRRGLAAHQVPGIRLVGAVLVGTTTYAGVLWVFHRRRLLMLRGAIDLIRRVERAGE